MKKKSPRGIPDFSHKPAKKGTTAPEQGHGPRVQSKAAPPPPPPRAKPPATSVKSGQRGT